MVKVNRYRENLETSEDPQGIHPYSFLARSSVPVKGCLLEGSCAGYNTERIIMNHIFREGKKNSFVDFEKE